MKNAWQLARIGDIPSPDSPDSPGAEFLLMVQNDVTEAVAEDAVADIHDAACAIADAAVLTQESRGTYRKWLAFADLLAWQEETGPVSNMGVGADRALYLIAERLATRLLEEVASGGDLD